MPLAETEDEVNKCQGNLISLCTFLCISIKGAVKGPMTNDDRIQMNLDELEMNFKEERTRSVEGLKSTLIWPFPDGVVDNARNLHKQFISQYHPIFLFKL